MANQKRDYLLETRLDVGKFRDARLASFARVNEKGGEDSVYVGGDSVEAEKVQRRFPSTNLLVYTPPGASASSTAPQFSF
jgi:hypothetical protein